MGYLNWLYSFRPKPPRPPPPAPLARNIRNVMREREEARLRAEDEERATQTFPPPPSAPLARNIRTVMREREEARLRAEEEARLRAEDKERATQTFLLNPLWKRTAPPNIQDYKLHGNMYVCKDDKCELYIIKYVTTTYGLPSSYRWSDGEYYTFENLQFFVKDIITEEAYKLLSPGEQGKYEKVVRGTEYGEEYTAYHRVLRGGKRRQTRRRKTKNKDKRKTKAKRRT